MTFTHHDLHAAGGIAESDAGDKYANNNIVDIVNLTFPAAGGDLSPIAGGVAGEYVDTGGGEAQANSNKVKVADSVVNDVYGGWAETGGVPSGGGKDVQANYNEVTLVNSKATSVIGGGGKITMGGLVEASRNTVNLTDTQVSGFVYGGWDDGTTGSNRITHNTVNLIGDVSIGGALFGGNITSRGANQDAFTGNALKVTTVGSHGTTVVGNVGGFENYSFVFDPATALDVNALTVSGTIYLYDHRESSTRPSVIAGVYTSGSQLLSVGNKVTLIDASSIDTHSGLFDQDSVRGYGGNMVEYAFDLEIDGSEMVATVTKVGVSEQSKSISEGFLGAMGFLTAGADHAAGGTLQSASLATQGPARGGTISGGGFSVAPFSAASVGSVRHVTGSHVDSKGFSVSLGVATRSDLSFGGLLLGAFLEGGKGSYDTYNYFPDIGQVVGSGDTDYFGGGLLSRLDFPTSSGAMYVEVSGRIGRSSNEYQSADLDSPGGGISKYSSTTPYYGVHVGVGHEFSFDEANSLDLYGKYLWTRQKGDDVTMSTGERISFDDVDSHRLKAGARYTRGLSPMLGVYGGAAYEHELDGKASAAVFGLPIEAPEMRGGTGVGELGLTINPMASGAVNLDLGVEGYVGKRRGVTGSLKVNFEF